MLPNRGSWQKQAMRCGSSGPRGGADATTDEDEDDDVCLVEKTVISLVMMVIVRLIRTKQEDLRGEEALLCYNSYWLFWEIRSPASLMIP